MKYQIKNRIDDLVIFECESDSMLGCVVQAVKEGKNLEGANLEGANLTLANLYGANLTRANLTRADLTRANLTLATLYGANLYGANLYGANLEGANLYGANLEGANLYGANLYGANLYGANLTRANLTRAKNVNPWRIDSLRMMLIQPGKIRAYKLVNENNEGPTNGWLKYIVGKTVSVKNANTDETVGCGAGVNLATLPWVMNEYREGYKVLLCEFTAKDIAAIPIGTDGKFRVHRCKVVKEVDLKAIGLIK